MKPLSSSGRVGIVVPTLGTRPEWLDCCIRSITTQTEKANILLVGPSTAALQSVADSHGIGFLAEDRRGLSRAINSGWDLLSGDAEYFTWLGDDDLLAPGSLKLTADTLQANPMASFVYGRTMYIDESGNTIYRSYPTRHAPRYIRIGQDYIPQPGSLLRVSAVDWSPLLDETLKNAMDLDLFLKLSKRGPSSWVYLPTELSAYRIHGEAITQQKGPGDESDHVRDRYRSNRARKVATALRAPRKILEKIYVWSLWHGPTAESRYDYYRTGTR